MEKFKFKCMTLDGNELNLMIKATSKDEAIEKIINTYQVNEIKYIDKRYEGLNDYDPYARKSYPYIKKNSGKSAVRIYA